VTKIIILNVEHVSTRAVFRQLWMADEGDIIVSPMPIDEEYLRYVCDTQGVDIGTISVITGNQRLTDEYLATGFTDLTAQLEKRLTGSSTWELMPCLYTEGIADLAERLGLRIDDALRFAAQRGPELLNRKSHFRQLAIGARLPIADGSIALNATALAKAIERHLPKTGTVIVKRDDGNGGRGNVTLTMTSATPMPGSRETRHVDGDHQATATALWDQLTDERNHTLVVESYHDATHCFYFEFLIDGQGRPLFLNSGTFHRRPDTDPAAPALVWVGLDLPAELPTLSAVHASSLTTQIVNLAAQVGYRGYINVDAILTEEKGIIINEINARWGGGLVLDAIGRRLIGERYADEHVISGVRDIEPMLLNDALKILYEHDLHYSPESQEGVVVLGYDALLERTLECAVIAADRPRSREIEARFRQAVAEDHR
jgi:hypothetical protein